MLDLSSALAQATNLIAAQIAARKASSVDASLKGLGVSPKDSADVAFNTACAAVQAGMLRDAKQLLELSERRGQEELIEENAVQVVSNELIILVRSACVTVFGMFRSTFLGINILFLAAWIYTITALTLHFSRGPFCRD
jgi:hypothetical protein